MAGNGIYKWWFAHAVDAEHWSGPEATREGAIAAGTVEFAGEPFAIFEADKSVCTPNARCDFLAEQIIDDLGECNEECWGEDGWDDAWSDEARRDLERSIETMVADWLKRHPAKTWSAGDVRVMEEITPQKAVLS